MKPSLLVFCYPTYSRALHIDSKGLHVVLAPEEIPNYFIKRGHRVEFVNLTPFDTDLPLMCSKRKMVRLKDVNPSEFDLAWHMFRDPLENEVSDIEGLFATLSHPKDTINHCYFLRNHYKHVYLPILYKHGVGPTVYARDTADIINWGPEEWSVAVSDNKAFIRVYDYNNNRGDYPEREKNSKLVVEYLDAAVDGKRSFFRLGYAGEKIVAGGIYTSPADKLIQKTGNCKEKAPHEMPAEFHAPIIASFKEMGIDACHFEGCYVGGKPFIFDVNPYPTSYGSTLRPMSELMAQAIIDKWHVDHPPCASNTSSTV